MAPRRLESQSNQQATGNHNRKGNIWSLYYLFYCDSQSPGDLIVTPGKLKSPSLFCLPANFRDFFNEKLRNAMFGIGRSAEAYYKRNGHQESWTDFDYCQDQAVV